MPCPRNIIDNIWVYFFSVFCLCINNSLKTWFLWLNDMSSYECTVIYGTIPLMENSLLVFSVLFVDVSIWNCEYLLLVFTLWWERSARHTEPTYSSHGKNSKQENFIRKYWELVGTRKTSSDKWFSSCTL